MKFSLQLSAVCVALPLLWERYLLAAVKVLVEKPQACSMFLILFLPCCAKHRRFAFHSIRPVFGRISRGTNLVRNVDKSKSFKDRHTLDSSISGHSMLLHRCSTTQWSTTTAAYGYSVKISPRMSTLSLMQSHARHHLVQAVER